jgi:hypothetical protein
MDLLRASGNFEMATPGFVRVCRNFEMAVPGLLRAPRDFEMAAPAPGRASRNFEMAAPGPGRASRNFSTLGNQGFGDWDLGCQRRVVKCESCQDRATHKRLDVDEA